MVLILEENRGHKVFPWNSQGPASINCIGDITNHFWAAFWVTSLSLLIRADWNFHNVQDMIKSHSEMTLSHVIHTSVGQFLEWGKDLHRLSTQVYYPVTHWFWNFSNKQFWYITIVLKTNLKSWRTYQGTAISFMKIVNSLRFLR